MGLAMIQHFMLAFATTPNHAPQWIPMDRETVLVIPTRLTARPAVEC
jgi:hypothetical protein